MARSARRCCPFTWDDDGPGNSPRTPGEPAKNAWELAVTPAKFLVTPTPVLLRFRHFLLDVVHIVAAARESVAQQEGFH
jgi:hypothetical protein